MLNRYFKGWARPGPLVEEKPDSPKPEAGETLDAISGNFRIFQLRDGHRFSTDDLLVAWYGTSWCPYPARALDLGSGIGSVAIAAAYRLPGTKFVTVEAQDESVRLARKSVAYNGLEDRFELRHGDFREPGVIKEDEKFDLILGSPPYFPLDGGILGDHPQKVACRFEVRGTVADYCSTATKHLDLGATFSCVFPVNPPGQLERIEAGARDAGLTIVRYRPIILREGEPPLLGVFVMTRSEHLPEDMRARTWIEPALTIRTSTGDVHPEYRAVKLAIGFPP